MPEKEVKTRIRIHTVEEVIALYNAGIINREEARALLGFSDSLEKIMEIFEQSKESEKKVSSEYDTFPDALEIRGGILIVKPYERPMIPTHKAPKFKSNK